MHTAPPDALLIDVRPALTAHVSESDFLRLFPVQFDDVDVLAAAEPSKAPRSTPATEPRRTR